jgi:transposase
MRKPGKSDRLDAHAVARLLREEAATLPVVLPEEQEAASVELWSRLREDVVAGMTQLRNRLVVHQERELRANIQRAVAEHFGPLTTIEGVGPPVAAGLIAELGAPRSGFGIPQLAALAGVAPLEASSAGGVRHRLNRLGNRRLNSLLYHIAIVQARCYVPARAYLARRQQEGRTPKEARRALKRQLVRRLWHHWQACWSAKSTTSPAIAPSLAS